MTVSVLLDLAEELKQIANINTKQYPGISQKISTEATKLQDANQEILAANDQASSPLSPKDLYQKQKDLGLYLLNKMTKFFNASTNHNSHFLSLLTPLKSKIQRQQFTLNSQHQPHQK